MNTNSPQIVNIFTTQSIKEWKLKVCHENYPFKEVNDTNDFEVSKLVGTIEWE